MHNFVNFFKKHSKKFAYGGVLTVGVLGCSVYFRQNTYSSKLKLDNKENVLYNKKKDKIDVNESKIELPTNVPYLIIGGGAAGLSAAKTIRGSDPLSKVLIINCEPQSPKNLSYNKPDYFPYRRPVLSKRLWLKSEDKLETVLDSSGDLKKVSFLYLEPDSFYIKPEKFDEHKYGGVSLLNAQRVNNLDPVNKTVTLHYGDADHTIKFQTCLLATGSKPRRLKHLETTVSTNEDLYNSGKVAYFRGLNDFRHLYEKLYKWSKIKNESSRPRRVLVLGAGLLGTELTWSMTILAETLFNKNSESKKGLDVIEVYKENAHLEHILPSALGAHVSKELAARSTVLVPDSQVVSIDSDNETGEGTVAVKLKHKIINEGDPETSTIRGVDQVIIAAGVVPNVELAECAGLETDYVNGGVLVNPELQSRDGIFAAGDVCSFFDPVLGIRRRVEHWDHAEESGMVAGHNMAAYVMLRSMNDSGGSYDDKLPLHWRHLKEEDGSDSECKKFYSWNQVISPSKLAVDILKPRHYDYQSSFYFNLGLTRSFEAVGRIDSSLETRVFIAKDMYPQDYKTVDNEEEETESSKEDNLIIPASNVGDVSDSNKQHQGLPDELSLLDNPGVVLYLHRRRIVGALLWNCDDELIFDSDSIIPGGFPAPLRTNVARKLIAERAMIRDDDDCEHILNLVRKFDLSYSLNSEMHALDLILDEKSEDGSDSDSNLEDSSKVKDPA